ncbi:MAG: GNAT family N-acetyltransferase [Candidatus Ratteibacteria bacterium]
MEYRTARISDLREVARLYIDGFKYQLHTIFGRHIPEKIFIDFLSRVRKFEKNGFIIACENKEIIGFTIMSVNPFNLYGKIFLLSFFPSVFSLISGKYRGICFHRALKSFFDFVRFSQKSSIANKKYKDAGQVITMVVCETMRGRGIGGHLLLQGLDYLKKYKKFVKLEVRQDNLPAIHLYKKNGFIETGVIHSKVGSSFVMVKHL